MKWLEIAFIIFVLNLTIAMYTQTGLIPTEGMHFQSMENVTSLGEVADQDSSLAYKIKQWGSNEQNEYFNKGIQDENQIYLFSGADFIRAFFFFSETIIKGTVLVYPTLDNIGVPSYLIYFITSIVWFFYVIAIIQLLAKWDFRGYK